MTRIPFRGYRLQIIPRSYLPPHRMSSTMPTVNKTAHPFDKTRLEALLNRRFFYAPAFEIYGGELIKEGKMVFILQLFQVSLDCTTMALQGRLYRQISSRNGEDTSLSKSTCLSSTQRSWLLRLSLKRLVTLLGSRIGWWRTSKLEMSFVPIILSRTF